MIVVRFQVLVNELSVPIFYGNYSIIYLVFYVKKIHLIDFLNLFLKKFRTYGNYLQKFIVKSQYYVDSEDLLTTEHQ